MRISPSRQTIILQLHRDLYKYSEKSIGGSFKNTQNYISATDAQGRSVVLFTPLSPYETPGAVEAIYESLARTLDAQELNPLILIPIFIHDFLCIHPFNDGNGRTSRLLTTLLLYRSGYLVGRYISLESKSAKNKDAYYDVLARCRQGWHEGKEAPTPFIKYLLSIILAAYREFEERVAPVGEKLPALEVVRRAAYGKVGKLTKSQLMELCPTLSKSSVEASVKKLVAEGALVMHGKGPATFYTRSDA